MQVKKTSHAIYEIRVEGALGEIWLNWFEGLKIHQEVSSENGIPITVISGQFPDQPALHGVIAKIRDLNLILISIQKVKEKGEFYNESV